MNFNIFRKLIVLPLSATEKAVSMALCYHVPKDSTSCFPSYETIKNESGCSSSTISKVILTLKYCNIIDFRNRAEVGTNKKHGGKLSNEYFFIFDGIGFYMDKLSKDNQIKFKTALKVARKKAKAELVIRKNKRKNKITVQSEMLPKDRGTVQSEMLPKGKSQNSNIEVCTTNGFVGGTVQSEMLPRKPTVQSEMLPISSTNKDPSNLYSTFEKQEQAWQVDDVSSQYKRSVRFIDEYS